MQILEHSILGLRANRLHYRQNDRQISVTLFPMVHVGEPAFYSDVFERAYAADLILTEGIASLITRRLTRAYRFMATEKSGLILQTNADPKSAPDKTLRADLTPEEFYALWQAVPVWLRRFVNIAAPLVGLKNRWFLDRSRLSKSLEMDDLTSRETHLSWHPKTASFETALLHARNAHLVAVLKEEISKASPGSHIAIIYGAAHIPAVLAVLPKLGFTVTKCAWMNVIKTG